MVPFGTETGPSEPFILASIKLVAANTSNGRKNIMEIDKIPMKRDKKLPYFMCVIGHSFPKVLKDHAAKIILEVVDAFYHPTTMSRVRPVPWGSWRADRLGAFVAPGHCQLNRSYSRRH